MSHSSGYLIGLVFGGLVAGGVCGIVPLLVGIAKGRPTLGLIGLLSSAFAGFVGGLVVAVPFGLILSIVTLVVAKRSPASIN